MIDKVKDLALNAGLGSQLVFVVDENGVHHNPELEKFVSLLLAEAFKPVNDLVTRANKLEPTFNGYDRDSYILGCNDAIAEIEEHFGIE